MMNFSIKMDGIEEVCKRLDHYDHETAKAATHAMVENVEDLLGQSMRIAPIDEGFMIGSASARVQGTEVARGNKDESITTKFGNPAADPGGQIVGEVLYSMPYALIQHENLQFRHKPGKTAKYLENPLKERVQRYVKNIADAIKAVNSK